MCRRCFLDGDDDDVTEDEAAEAKAEGYEAKSMKMRLQKPRLKETNAPPTMPSIRMWRALMMRQILLIVAD